jgi:hypothetical protein
LCFVEQESRCVRVDDPAVSEMVVEKLEDITSARFTGALRDALLDAVSITLALAERYWLNGGSASASLRRLRTKARADQRLTTHLAQALGNPCAAAWLARLLIGPDRAPIESALLWWCTRCEIEASDVPDPLRRRWIRCLDAADDALAW